MRKAKTVEKLIVFTDLDGTLLDSRTYSFEEALPALKLLKEREIPLVLSSSKTRTEVEHYRRLLDNHDPFIVENGGAVFIPKGYFPFPISELDGLPVRADDFYEILELGVPYPSLVQALRNIREELELDLRGFSDMEKEEVVALSGLSMAEAAMALQREWGEPFWADLSLIDMERLERAVLERGLRLTVGNRFYHLTGLHDKGRAVKVLIRIYQRKEVRGDYLVRSPMSEVRSQGDVASELVPDDYGPRTTDNGQFVEVKSVALGDSLNDLPMLQAVDVPIFLTNSEGGFDPSALAGLSRAILAKEAGPRGWNRAILEIETERKSGDRDFR